MSFCPNCGAQLQEGAKFCANCGTPVQQVPVQQAPAQQQKPVQPAPAPQPTPQRAPQPTPQPVQAAPQPGSTITLGQDGKYHWYYEVKMLKNTAILGTLLKVFGGVVAGMWLFANAMNGFEDVGPTTKVMLIILGVIVVLTLLGYLLVAAMYGGKYCVLFEMDEKGVSHTQLPKQFKKAQVMGLVSAFAGGSPGTVAPGLLAATRNSLYSDFRSVRTIKPKPGQHLIKVNAPMSKNQIYVEDQDFQFVLDFIRSHCPKAR